MDWSSFDGVVIDLDNETRESLGLRRTDKIYEEEYISSWQSVEDSGKESLIPSNLENFKEKLLGVPEFSRWLSSKGNLLNGSV